MALVLLFVLGAAALLTANGLVRHKTQDRILPPSAAVPADRDCILVLGCGVYPDGSPSPMLRDRVARGAELYHLGWADTLLLTGDDSDAHRNEVAVMTRLATEAGVPPEAILRDPYGLCTYDSMYRARNVYGFTAPVVVTQNYHLYRAIYLAQAMVGTDAVGVAAQGENYPGQSMRDAREMLARVKDLFTAALLPEPPYPTQAPG